jgi:hypothetical protein
MPEIGHVALFAEPVAEPRYSERLAELGHKERQMPLGVASMIRRGISSSGAGGAFGLLAGPLEDHAFDVLRCHGDNILPRLTRIKPIAKASQGLVPN